MPEPRFIHLRLHSAYSLLEGAIPVKALPKLCAAAGHAGGGADRHRQPLRRARVLRGRGQGRASSRSSAASSTLAYATPAHPGDRPPPPRPVVLLAQDEAGFAQPDEAQLAQLSRLRRRRAARHARRARRPRRRADLPDRRRRRPARRADRATATPARAARAGRAARRRSSRTGSTSRSSATRENGAPRTAAEAATEPGLVGLAYDLDLPLVATNDVHFPTPRPATTRTTRCSASPTAPMSTSRSRAGG